MGSNAANFFTKDGRRLKGISAVNTYSDQISTLYSDYEPVQSISESKSEKIKRYLKNVTPKMSAFTPSFSLALFVSIIFSTFLRPVDISLFPQDKYFIYSSKPLTVEQAISNITSQDSRPQKINEIFKRYNCPLEGMGEVFVKEADEHNIPWTLVAAVAFQESSCGKNTPKINGQESYNAWGWGVYGDNMHGFDNWARGIETVTKYFSDRFFSKGITETCEIMKVYTPPSNGSWCNGVDEFSGLIANFQSQN